MLCVRVAKALARLCICAGSPEHSPFTDTVNKEISCNGPSTCNDLTVLIIPSDAYILA